MIEPIHPGEHVKEELDALEVPREVFAQTLNVTTERLSDLLEGRTGMDADMALRLAHYFGNPAEFWMSLQNLYELRLAEQRFGEAIQVLPTLRHKQAA